MKPSTSLQALSLLVLSSLSGACATGADGEEAGLIDEATSNITAPDAADGTDTCGLDGVFTCTDNADVWEQEIRHLGGCTAVPFEISMRSAARSGAFPSSPLGTPSISPVTRTFAITDTSASICGSNWGRPANLPPLPPCTTFGVENANVLRELSMSGNRSGDVRYYVEGGALRIVGRRLRSWVHATCIRTAP